MSWKCLKYTNKWMTLDGKLAGVDFGYRTKIIALTWSTGHVSLSEIMTKDWYSPGL